MARKCGRCAARLEDGNDWKVYPSNQQVRGAFCRQDGTYVINVCTPCYTDLTKGVVKRRGSKRMTQQTELFDTSEYRKRKVRAGNPYAKSNKLGA